MVAPETVGFVALVVLLAGALNGVAGFGFALVGTMALASRFEPAVAVVFMILPILAVNLSLASDLSTSRLRSCSQRFWPLVLSALVGTVLGMVVLESLPGDPLRIALGIVSLAFVGTAQRLVPVPSVSLNPDRSPLHSPVGMVGVGSISGVLFGGTNVGVQVIAYLRSFDLSHGLFVGVVAMVFLGLNAIRVLLAGLLGLYPGLAVLGASLAATVPAVAGVAIGKRLRSRVSERNRRAVVLGLLTLIGVRLVLGGLGIV